jgi:hypothetical protein
VRDLDVDHAPIFDCNDAVGMFVVLVARNDPPSKNETDDKFLATSPTVNTLSVVVLGIVVVVALAVVRYSFDGTVSIYIVASLFPATSPDPIAQRFASESAFQCIRTLVFFPYVNPLVEFEYKKYHAEDPPTTTTFPPDTTADPAVPDVIHCVVLNDDPMKSSNKLNVLYPFIRLVVTLELP